MISLGKPVQNSCDPPYGLFLDADGVLWQDRGPGGVLEVQEPSPDATSAISRARGLLGNRLRVIVVSNQTCVSRGMCSETKLSQKFSELLLDSRIVDGIYLSVDHPEATIFKYRKSTGWRKPAPGMFVAAAAEWRIALSESAMVGDRITDVIASTSAGISKNFLVLDDRSFERNMDNVTPGLEGLSATFTPIHTLSEIDWMRIWASEKSVKPSG